MLSNALGERPINTSPDMLKHEEGPVGPKSQLESGMPFADLDRHYEIGIQYSANQYKVQIRIIFLHNPLCRSS